MSSLLPLTRGDSSFGVGCVPAVLCADGDGSGGEAYEGRGVATWQR